MPFDLKVTEVRPGTGPMVAAGMYAGFNVDVIVDGACAMRLFNWTLKSRKDGSQYFATPPSRESKDNSGAKKYFDYMRLFPDDADKTNAFKWGDYIALQAVQILTQLVGGDPRTVMRPQQQAPHQGYGPPQGQPGYGPPQGGGYAPPSQGGYQGQPAPQPGYAQPAPAYHPAAPAPGAFPGAPGGQPAPGYQPQQPAYTPPPGPGPAFPPAPMMTPGGGTPGPAGTHLPTGPAAAAFPLPRG